MVEQEAVLRRPDLTLSYYTVVPEDPKAVLVLLHGLSEHKGRYLRLARELAAEGFAVWAYDQRGFGKSTGRRTDLTDYNDLLNDLSEVIAAVKRAHPGLPLILIGHSLGGVVLSVFCINYPNTATGLVLSAPAYEFFPLPKRVHLAGVLLNYLFPKVLIPYPSEGTNLSHDPEVSRAFKADPLTQSSGTPRFYHAFRKMNHYLRQHADRIVLPTLILQGTADTTVVPAGANALYERIRSDKKRLIFYEGFYHEPFNEIGRERVLSDLVEWVRNLLGPALT